MVGTVRLVSCCSALGLVAAAMPVIAPAQATLDAYQAAVYDSTPLLYYTFDNDTIGTGSVADAMGAYNGSYLDSSGGAKVLSVQGPHGVVGHVPYTSPGADFRDRAAYVSTGLPFSSAPT